MSFRETQGFDWCWGCGHYAEKFTIQMDTKMTPALPLPYSREILSNEDGTGDADGKEQ